TGGDAVAWSWSSSGTASFNNTNIQNPQATGVADGEIFTVTVTDVNGCTSTATTTATVNALPACSASTGGAICAGGTLTLMETGGDATSWSWTSNGGATIMDANMATATATGVTNGEIFTVVITDANGCTSSCSVMAVVNQLPGCAATNSGPVCEGQPLTIEETGGDAVSWSWSSNGAAVINDATAMVAWATNVSDGEIFTVTITDVNGCTSTCSTTAIVYPEPAAVASNNGPICSVDALDLMETGGDAVSWSWSSSGSAALNDPFLQNPTATGVSNNEIFTVVVTDANGCTNTASTVATVNSMPVCGASNDGPICEGGTLTLTDAGNWTTWSWSSNGSAVIDDPSAQTTTATNVTDGEIFT
ncbi:MAG: hypothetical protein R3330_18620, partial [Saprospiraceae bacterium]|nr:hypothetical protein [Saprospiraceae bacterium]